MQFGTWEGQEIRSLDQREDWRRFNAIRSVVQAPGGEFMIETQTRMVRQLERIRQRHDREGVAVVSHAEPLRAVLAHYTGIPLDLVSRVEIHPASVSVVEVGPCPPRIHCVNATGEIAV